MKNIRLIKKLKKVFVVKKMFPILLLVLGAIGMMASAAIAIEKEDMLKNPQTELVCNLNPVYSCSNVFMSPQAEIFGFSNELMGIAMFAALITLGVVLLAGAQLKKWLWHVYLGGMLFFMGFVVWFFYQSVYTIGSLCIFCSIVWFSAWGLTANGFAWIYDNGYLKEFKKIQKPLQFIRRNIIAVWLLFIITIVVLILNHFWFYYGQYFGF